MEWPPIASAKKAGVYSIPWAISLSPNDPSLD